MKQWVEVPPIAEALTSYAHIKRGKNGRKVTKIEDK